MSGLPCDHGNRRTGKRRKRLAPRAGREQPDRLTPLFGGNQHDVNHSLCAAVLKSIVEHSDSRSELRSFFDPLRSAFCDDYWDVGIQPGVNQWLVSAIPAKNDGRLRPALDELTREPRGKRRLARSADGKVSNANHGDFRMVHRQELPVVQPPSRADNGAIDFSRRNQSGTSDPGQQVVAPPDPFDHSQARRSASSIKTWNLGASSAASLEVVELTLVGSP
jgi:hypothetical protein